MTYRLLAFAVAAAAAFVSTPAQAEEVCRSVRVDLINDWTYCVGAAQNADGGVTVWITCDMGQNACPNPSITIP